LKHLHLLNTMATPTSLFDDANMEWLRSLQDHYNAGGYQECLFLANGVINEIEASWNSFRMSYNMSLGHMVPTPPIWCAEVYRLVAEIRLHVPDTPHLLTV
jgi:hypothetical protein